MTTIEEQKEKNASMLEHPKWYCLLLNVDILKDAHSFKRCKCYSYGVLSLRHFYVQAVGDMGTH